MMLPCVDKKSSKMKIQSFPSTFVFLARLVAFWAKLSKAVA